MGYFFLTLTAYTMCTVNTPKDIWYTQSHYSYCEYFKFAVCDVKPTLNVITFFSKIENSGKA